MPARKLTGNASSRPPIADHKRRAEDFLSGELNLLRTLIDNLPDSIFVKDLETRFILSNDAHLRQLGATTMDEVLGQTDFDRFPRELAERYSADDHAVMKTGRPLMKRIETAPGPNGEMRWLSTSKLPLRDSGGSIVGLIGINHDITARKCAEDELLRLALIVESSSDAIMSTNQKREIVSWNKAAEAIFGYTASEVLGKRISLFTPPHLLEESEFLSNQVRSGLAVKNIETVRRRKDGTLIDVSITMSPVLNASGELLGVSAIVRDISERKRMEKEILEISENERRRLGHDLHDDLCQHLAGVSLLANVLHQTLATKAPDHAADSHRINDLIKQAVSRSRILAQGLAHQSLSGEGFVKALQEMVMGVERLFNTPCEFKCDKSIALEDAAVAAHLYRIAQEAAHNAAKHSRADRILIHLDHTDGTITLTVDDNGIGYPDPLPAHTGLGMQIMNYRARMIGGVLRFDHKKTGGTAVICSLPAPRLTS